MARNNTAYSKAFHSRSVQQRLFACAMEANIPTCLLGPTGVGKTAFVSSFAEQSGYVFQLLSAPQLEPEYVTRLRVGVNDRNEDDNFGIGLAETDWLDYLNNAEKSMLFIDDLTSASGRMKVVLSSVIKDRRAGLRTLSDHVRIVAAGVPRKWSPEVLPLSAGLRTSMLQIYWEPDSIELKKDRSAGSENWIPPTISSDMRCIGRDVLNQITGILYNHQDLIEASNINDIDLDLPINAPKSWSNVMRISEYIPEGDYEVLHAAMCGLVGEEIGDQVGALLRNQLPIDQILSDPTSFDWANEPGDRVYAALLSVTDRAFDTSVVDVSSDLAARIFQVAADAGYGGVAWQFLVRLTEHDQDFTLSQSIATTFQPYMED